MFINAQPQKGKYATKIHQNKSTTKKSVCIRTETSSTVLTVLYYYYYYYLLRVPL